ERDGGGGGEEVGGENERGARVLPPSQSLESMDPSGGDGDGWLEVDDDLAPLECLFEVEREGVALAHLLVQLGLVCRIPARPLRLRRVHGEAGLRAELVGRGHLDVAYGCSDGGGD